MKSAAEKLLFFRRNPSLGFLSQQLAIRKISTCTGTTTNGSAALTEEEVSQINAVIPTLCSSNHLKEAITLISAAISTSNPPLTSLPLPSLVDRLALEPDLTHPMHLLNALKYNPNTGNPDFLFPIAKLFVSSFFRQGCPKRAVKIFQWVLRPDFPGGVAMDLEFYALLIDGFCKNRMMLDCLHVVRVMARENLGIRSEVRTGVFRGLLREARVREALEVNAALGGGTQGSGGGGTVDRKELVDLLDRMIANWVD